MCELNKIEAENNSPSLKKEIGNNSSRRKKIRVAIVLGTISAIGAFAFFTYKNTAFHSRQSLRLHRETTPNADIILETAGINKLNDSSSFPKVIKVDSFIRNLPEHCNASSAAHEFAESQNIKLAEHQTIVRPYTKTYQTAS